MREVDYYNIGRCLTMNCLPNRGNFSGDYDPNVWGAVWPDWAQIGQNVWQTQYDDMTVTIYAYPNWYYVVYQPTDPFDFFVTSLVHTFASVVDVMFHITDTINDVGTILNGNASTGDRLKAAGSLVFSVVSDALFFTPVGEGADAAELGVDAVQMAADSGELLSDAAALAADSGAIGEVSNLNVGSGLEEDAIDFAHGTSLEYAQNIVSGGLSEVAARVASAGGLYAEAGSFFYLQRDRRGTRGNPGCIRDGFPASPGARCIDGSPAQDRFR